MMMTWHLFFYISARRLLMWLMCLIYELDVFDLRQVGLEVASLFAASHRPGAGHGGLRRPRFGS